MSGQSVEELLEQLAHTAPSLHEIVQQVRSLVAAEAPDVVERVMYGGIVFEAPTMFCGVFAYTRHVSVEFSRGSELVDPYGVLEGKGGRRHVKLRDLEDVEARHVAAYVAIAYAASLPA